MNSQYKFRGIHNAGWKKGFLSYNFKTNQHEIVNSQGVWPVISESVGQYTGRQDRNGKEIYVGDILRCTFNPYFASMEEAEAVYGAGNIIKHPKSGAYCLKGTEHTFNGTIEVATKYNEYSFTDEDEAIAEVKHVDGTLHTDSELRVSTYDTDGSGNTYCDGCKDAGLSDFYIYQNEIFNTFEIIGNVHENPQLLEVAK